MQIRNMDRGLYTMQFALDTKSALGTLIAKRGVQVGEPLENVAQREGRIAKTLTRFIKSAEKRVITGGAGERLSAVIEFHPDSDYLRVSVDVTDPHFSTGDTKSASRVEVFMSPAATPESVSHFVVFAQGSGNEAKVYRTNLDSSKDEDAPNVKATCQRTEKGYTVSLRIPWTEVREYQKGWTVMPVQAAVGSTFPDGRHKITLTNKGKPWIVNKYTGLRATGRTKVAGG